MRTLTQSLTPLLAVKQHLNTAQSTQLMTALNQAEQFNLRDCQYALKQITLLTRELNESDQSPQTTIRIREP